MARSSKTLGICLKLSHKIYLLAFALLANVAQATQAAEKSALWFTGGALTDNGRQLVQLLNDPSPFGLQLSPETVATPISASQLSNSGLEHRFTELASSLGQGSIRADQANQWHIPQDEFSVEPLLERLRSGDTLAAVLSSISPSTSEYSQLLTAFQHYQRIVQDGGWPTIAESDHIIRPGARHVDIPVLRNRLRIEGDFAGGMQADPFFYGQELVNALKQFQIRYGLLADGTLDRQTRAALQIPASERLQQIRINLERWRWLPRQLASRRLWVNTAGAFAQLIDGSEVQLQLRAIAGRPYRATPSLLSSIERMVVNPAWGVPHRIAVQDLLPLQKKNKHFFAQKNIRVFHNADGRSVEVNPGSIDWSGLSAKHFPYQLRQDPGTQNSMGRIKFVFDNPFNVFLHDTPNKVLFELPNRNFSSGCVRIENPFELANAILSDTPRTLDTLQQLSSPGNSRTQSVTLEKSLPIYLVYMTNWFDDDGLLHFSKDRYGRDHVLSARLKQQQESRLAATQTFVH